MTEHSQSENKTFWELSENQLCSLVDPDLCYEPIEKQIQWFRNTKKFEGAETQQEIMEKKQATYELVQSGIVKVKKTPPKLELVNGNKIKDKKGNLVKIGPNQPCPCGSGKKFKKCHGRFST